MNVSFRETVEAPIEKVFDVFSDFPNAAQRIEGIERVEMLTDGPVGSGTRFKETRIMFGRETTEEMQVTNFEPNKSYLVEADSCGSHFQTEFRFSQEGNRTLVEMEMTTTANTLFAKLMSPLGFLMSGTMKKCMIDDINQLKQHCEIS
jgi:carbon monoxide dehydrogenase subunit G